MARVKIPSKENSSSPVKQLFCLAVPLLIFAIIPELPAATERVLQATNSLGGRTIQIDYEFRDMERMHDGDSNRILVKDKNGTNRIEIIMKTWRYRWDNGDFKEVRYHNNLGKVLRVDCHRTNQDVYKEGWYRKTRWYDTAERIDHIEYFYDARSAKSFRFIKKREEYDPEDRLIEEWLYFTKEHQRESGEKYETTYFEYTPYRRIFESVVCKSNPGSEEKKLLRVFEHFRLGSTINTSKEFDVNISACPGIKYYRMDRTYIRGVPQTETYRFTDSYKKTTGAAYAEVILDPAVNKRSQLTLLNERKAVLKKIYGEKEISAFLGDWKWE